MLHIIIFGLLLGYGAAIPIGPINLEIMRRNLHFGTAMGLALGFGACSADVTYLVLLSLGALKILAYPLVLKIIGVVGSVILAWFGYNALRLKSSANDNNKPLTTHSFWRNYLEGYVLTLINPYTILFWSSISTTLALVTHANSQAIVYAGIGVLLSTSSWIVGLNTLLHFTKHRFSPRVMRWLNIMGGVILIGFAIIGLWHAF